MRRPITKRSKSLVTLLLVGGVLLTYFAAEPMELKFVCSCGTGRQPGGN